MCLPFGVKLNSHKLLWKIHQQWWKHVVNIYQNNNMTVTDLEKNVQRHDFSVFWWFLKLLSVVYLKNIRYKRNSLYFWNKHGYGKKNQTFHHAIVHSWNSNSRTRKSNCKIFCCLGSDMWDECLIMAAWVHCDPWDHERSNFIDGLGSFQGARPCGKASTQPCEFNGHNECTFHPNC